MTFEYLNDFRVFEWILSLWMISLCLNLEILIDFSGLLFTFDFLIDSRLFNYYRVFQWLSSIWMIIEIFDYFREFGRYSSIWMKYEFMIDFRVFELFSRISIILKFIIPPLTPICKASREGTREAYFRGFEWFSSIWMIFGILIYFRIFLWLSSFWLIFEFF